MLPGFACVDWESIMTTMREWTQTMGAFQEAGVSAQGDGASLFVNLKDGESARGVFLGQPYARRVVWDEAARRSVKFDASQHPEREARFQVSFNFYDSEAKALRILEVNKRTFGQICDLTERLEKQGGGLGRWECKISRRGAGKDTQYWVDTVRELPDGALTKLAGLMSTDQHDLEAIMNDGEVATRAKETHMTLREPIRAPVRDWDAGPVDGPRSPEPPPVAQVQAQAPAPAPTPAPTPTNGGGVADFDLF